AIALLVCGEYVNADLVDAIRTVDRELPERNADRERLRLALAEASDPGEGAAIGDAVTTGCLDRAPGGGVDGVGVGDRASADDEVRLRSMPAVLRPVGDLRPDDDGFAAFDVGASELFDADPELVTIDRIGCGRRHARRCIGRQIPCLR